MRTLNLDLDGVIYPFHAALKSFAIKYRLLDFEDVVHAEPTKWEFWEDWNISEGEWKSVFRKGVEQGVVWGMGSPVPGSVSALWRIAEAGWNIRIVTNRLVHKFGHHAAITQTADWLDQHNIPYWDICFLGKSEKHDLYAEAMIDDNIVNCELFKDRWPQSTVILFKQPWNESLYRKGWGIELASGWQNVEKILKERKVLQSEEHEGVSPFGKDYLFNDANVVWEGIKFDGIDVINPT